MEIEDFEWDDDNETKIFQRIDPDEVDEVLDSDYTIIRNKNNRAGTHRLMGRSHAGKLITVVIAPTGNPGTWRPISAWLSDSEEQAHARKAGI